ncbi:MAG: hypothetical protein Harvfovirus29_11 [Harvfovirus sp.]|uniref:Uncharacterized protein n=1 Tax=Harvfovirus sp. TaxID=2487768 RepID=A0A3G5A2D2_9VIRU|nr:MAG: hypothetical protein Harvfovirus29_11 [Harvfovirus sp.]
MGGSISCRQIIKKDISTLPTRLRPIFFLNGHSIIFVDFVKGRLITTNGRTSEPKFQSSWSDLEIWRVNDQIYITHLWQLWPTPTLNVHTENPTLTFITPKEKNKLSNTPKQICQMQYLKDSDGSSLIKLHSNKRFCYHTGNDLYFGELANDKIMQKKISYPLFPNIIRFCLTHDDLLMLLILVHKPDGKFSYSLIFIDCDEVKIITTVELPGNIPKFEKGYRHYFFAELTPTRQDYLHLQNIIKPSIEKFLPPPLATTVFVYIFGDLLL